MMAVFPVYATAALLLLAISVPTLAAPMNGYHQIRGWTADADELCWSVQLKHGRQVRPHDKLVLAYCDETDDAQFFVSTSHTDAAGWERMHDASSATLGRSCDHCGGKSKHDADSGARTAVFPER